MTFEDLTPWDLQLIKSNAVHAMAFTRASDRFEVIVECTLDCIFAKGFNVNPYPKDLFKIVAYALAPKESYNSPRYELSFQEIVKEVFAYLKASRLEITRDEKRKSTWSVPKESWYAENKACKKPWVF